MFLHRFFSVGRTDCPIAFTSATKLEPTLLYFSLTTYMIGKSVSKNRGQYFLAPFVCCWQNRLPFCIYNCNKELEPTLLYFTLSTYMTGKPVSKNRRQYFFASVFAVGRTDCPTAFTTETKTSTHFALLHNDMIGKPVSKNRGQYIYIYFSSDFAVVGRTGNPIAFTSATKTSTHFALLYIDHLHDWKASK